VLRGGASLVISNSSSSRLPTGDSTLLYSARTATAAAPIKLRPALPAPAVDKVLAEEAVVLAVEEVCPEPVGEPEAVGISVMLPETEGLWLAEALVSHSSLDNWRVSAGSGKTRSVLNSPLPHFRKQPGLLVWEH